MEGTKELRILLTGGSACGKSTLAERLLMEQTGPSYYIDAMLHNEETRLERTERLKHLRSRKEIHIAERCTGISGICLPRTGTALFECLCTLTANEMFSRDGVGRKEVKEAVLTGMESLAQKCRDVIVITNEVGSDSGQYSRQTEEYREVLGRINTEMALRSDVVIEMVCGIPVILKGSLAGWNQTSENNWTTQTDRTPQSIQTAGRTELLLVTGGAGSGKLSYVHSQGWKEEDIADAVLDDRAVVYHAEAMAGSMETRVLVGELLKKKIVVINEAGSGIIPADAKQRAQRIETGRMAIQLAARAEHVIRLICGIPVIIK